VSSWVPWLNSSSRTEPDGNGVDRHRSSLQHRVREHR
jgi:hypothetical protein